MTKQELPWCWWIFAPDLCGTADVRAKLQQAERMEEEVWPHLAFTLWQAAVWKQLMQLGSPG